GWYTQPQSGNLFATESQRVDLIGGDANTFWRTDCGVAGMAPYSWVSAEVNQQDPENWYGLASTWTGEPHPSGTAYAQQIQLALGEAASPPPTTTLTLCADLGPSPPASPEPGLLPGLLRPGG